MKLVFASDSFKGTLSSEQTVELLTKAAHEVFGPCETFGVPVADGGEGTTDAVILARKGQKVYEEVHGPLMETVKAYYGRLSEEKGIMTLLQAFNKANVEKPLYIVGAGPQETELRDYIQHNMSGKTVKMLGYKTGDELKQIVSSAYCVILPSICCENAPYSIMESQAMGRPAIVSDNGGLPELVTEGVNGYIFHGSDANDLCSKLEKMEHSSFPGNEICQMAREKFSQEKYVLTLISEYKRLIKPL